MSRPLKKSYDIADASLTGFASNVTGATWTITTTTTADGYAHQVSIKNDTANDHSAKTATLVGTDANGDAQTEVVSLPAGSATVESTGYYVTLTSVTPSATIGADTMDIGWVDEIASNTIPLNVGFAQNAATVSVNVTGTIDFTVQETFELVLQGDAPIWSDVTALAAKTADTTAQISLHASATRLKVNSYSSGAEITMVIHQDRGFSF